MIKDFKTRLWTHIGIIMLVIAGTVVGWALLKMDIEREAAEIFQNKSDLATHTKIITQVNSLSEDAKKAEPMMQKMDAVLPKEIDMNVAKETYEKIAATKKISINWRYGDQTKSTATTPGSVVFMMLLQGEYKNIISFLEAVENERFYVTIQSVDVTSIDKGAQSVGQIGGILYFK